MCCGDKNRHTPPARRRALSPLPVPPPRHADARPRLDPRVQRTVRRAEARPPHFDVQRASLRHCIARVGDEAHQDLSHFGGIRSEEHTSELQSQSNLVCRLLLEKNKKHIRKSCHTLTSTA